MTPLVSIIIPVYNRRKIIIETVECALKQTYSNIEIIIGDNKSTDGTFEFLQKKYGNLVNVLIFQNTQNIGPVENWRVCLEKAKGKYIKILWSDDLMEESFLEKMVKELEKDSSLAFAYCTVKFFNEIPAKEINVLDGPKSDYMFKIGPIRIQKRIADYILGKTGKYERKAYLDSIFLYKKNAPVSATCALFRKDNIAILNKIKNKPNYLHSNTGAGIDLRIFLDSLVNYKYFYFLNEPLAYFRCHADSITLSDSKIHIGYTTAKLDYLLSSYNNYKYFKYIDATIVEQNVIKYNVFNRKECINSIKKYYDTTYSLQNTFNYFGLLYRVLTIRGKNKLNSNFIVGNLKRIRFR